MPPFDAQIIETNNYFKVLAKAPVTSFWIVADAWIQVTAENPWAGVSFTHDLGNGRFLLEMDGQPEAWTFNGPAFATSGNIIAATCAGPTGIVKFKE
jgi:hypothetical protein